MAERAITVAAWESLFRAQVTVMRALAAEFPSEIISLNEYDVLFNITRAPGRRLRLKELNRNVLITQPSVSRLVDRLAARGLLKKSHDPEDGRGTIVAITEEGFALFRRVAFAHMDAITRHVGSALDEPELRQLIELCDRLRRSVGHPNGVESNGADPDGADSRGADPDGADPRGAEPPAEAQPEPQA